MKKSRRILRSTWDLHLASLLEASFETVEREFREHSGFVRWVAYYVLFPFSLFYVVFGLLVGQNVFDSLFVGLLVFSYSNFVPDLDTMLKPTEDRRLFRSTNAERFALLFFGPIFIYYLLSSQSKPIYSQSRKEFHKTSYLVAYAAFLAAVGLLFWNNWLERFSLTFFGSLGYACHLFIDGFIRIPFLKK